MVCVMGERDDIFASARRLARAIRLGELSPSEALDTCLERVDRLNPELVAVIWRNDDDARERARQATDRLARTPTGERGDLPPFFGVPLPVKDLTAVAGWPVTYGSWAAPDRPSEESALVVEAFERGGFLLTGRTNTPEFGPITAAENLRYGVSRNPWDRDRTPGGSSGGAAAAVAAGMFPVAHANDGGGSIRIPASCCGLVGLKVSRGRVPNRVNSWEGGSVEGVVTRDVADTAAVLDVISGFDRGLWYNAPPPERPFADEVGSDPGSLRVGLVETAPFGLPLDQACLDAVRHAGQLLESLGHRVAPVSFEIRDEFLAAFLNVVNSGLADYDDIDWDRAEPHVRANRAAAVQVDSLSYVRSVHQLQRFTRELVVRWGTEFDVLLTPTMSIAPPRAGEILAAVHEGAGGGPALSVFQMAVFTSGFNMTGQPAVSLPTYTTEEGLPIGVQVVGGPWEEALLLRLAAQMEPAAGWLDREFPARS